MTIAYFPEIYPEELFYSTLSRFYVKSGYLTYQYAAKVLYANSKVRPDIEFINPIRPEVINILTKQMDFEELIMKHTMFPYYARFLSKEKRSMAYNSIIHMEGNYYNLLSISQKKETRVLKYCPICVEEDRDMYGECYWHRTHQIPGLSICSNHGCRLIQSQILISGKSSPGFHTAENNIGDMTVLDTTLNDKQLAKYINSLMEQRLNFENEVDVGVFLRSKLAGTSYVSGRGKQKNISLLQSDFKKFYENFSYIETGFGEAWQIEKILTGYRKNPSEIILLSYLLDIKVTELADMKMPLKTEERLFDEKVLEMVSAGKGINQTARELGNISPSTVKLICQKNGIVSKYKQETDDKRKLEMKNRIDRERKFWLSAIDKYPGKSYTALCQIPDYGPHLLFLRRADKEWTDRHWPGKTPHKMKRTDWDKIDREMLPLVKDRIRQLKGTSVEKPHRITEYAICRILGLPERRFQILPKCKKEISRHKESQKEYWEREIVWAVNKLKSEGSTVNWKHIRELTNMKKENFESCSYFLNGNMEYEKI
jgi:hypothetical protein